MKRRSALALCLTTLLLQGCIFSPKKGNELPPPPKPYEKPASPQAVIRNLALAYKQKDSAAYVACYDAQYTGSSVDQVTQTPPISVTWADEAAHIGFLIHSQVSNIDALTKPNLDNDRFHDSGDRPDWDTIQDPLSKLEIVDPTRGDGGTIWTIPLGAGELNIFKFVGVPNSGATDSTWKIISWQEVRQ